MCYYEFRQNLNKRKVLSMYKSILQFVEKDIIKIEESVKLMLKGEKDVNDLSNDIHKKVLSLGNNLLSEFFEKIDDEIRESVERKKKWYVEKRNQEKEILDIMGPIKFKRTGYSNKTTGDYIYLLDEVLGFESNQRMTLGVAANILEEATESSYRKGGENASISEKVSKQTAKNLVHNTVIEMPLPKVKKKRKKKKLYIVADEDHSSAQYWNEKGDLEHDKRGYKINTIMPKIICLYEDIINESGENSANPRYKLMGKRYFCGVYKGEEENEAFWRQVNDYIEHVYDTDVLESVYIAGDGASWIKTGCEVIDKSRFVLDKFHMMKYINTSVTHLFDSADDAKVEIWDAINTGNKEELTSIYKRIMDVTEKENKQEEVRVALRYLLNHWDGIIIRLEDPNGNWKCCAEGQVSHVLSSRLSSRPMGWTVLGCNQMSKLRAFKYNGGKVIDLLRYQKKNKKVEQKRREHDEIIKTIKRNRTSWQGSDAIRASVPGLGRTEMHWIRDWLDGDTSIA